MKIAECSKCRKCCHIDKLGKYEKLVMPWASMAGNCKFLGDDGCTTDKPMECEDFPFYVLKEGLWVFIGCPAVAGLLGEDWVDWWSKRVWEYSESQLRNHKAIIEMMPSGYQRVI